MRSSKVVVRVRNANKAEALLTEPNERFGDAVKDQVAEISASNCRSNCGKSLDQADRIAPMLAVVELDMHANGVGIDRLQLEIHDRPLHIVTCEGEAIGAKEKLFVHPLRHVVGIARSIS